MLFTFMCIVNKMWVFTILAESASNAVGSLRQRSWLNRTATSVWQRERAFDKL